MACLGEDSEAYLLLQVTLRTLSTSPKYLQYSPKKYNRSHVNFILEIPLCYSEWPQGIYLKFQSQHRLTVFRKCGQKCCRAGSSQGFFPWFGECSHILPPTQSLFSIQLLQAQAWSSHKLPSQECSRKRRGQNTWHLLLCVEAVEITHQANSCSKLCCQLNKLEWVFCFHLPLLSRTECAVVGPSMPCAAFIYNKALVVT